ncbi:MAG: hypothetical protein ABUT20_66670, partial [Bacteroidota bacterium]
MYQFAFSTASLESFTKATRIATGLYQNLVRLGTNPLSNSIPTNIPAIGDYYINAGRYCVVFNVDTA